MISNFCFFNILIIILGHELSECTGVAQGENGDVEKVFEETRYIFVRLPVLREYLERELVMPGIDFKYDFERALDDWVFMCFFVGKYTSLMKSIFLTLC